MVGAVYLLSKMLHYCVSYFVEDIKQPFFYEKKDLGGLYSPALFTMNTKKCR